MYISDRSQIVEIFVNETTLVEHNTNQLCIASIFSGTFLYADISFRISRSLVQTHYKLVTSNFYVTSDTSNKVVGPDNVFSDNSVRTYDESWISDMWTASIPGAIWIWDYPHVTNPALTQTCMFTNYFNVLGIPITAEIYIAADNNFKLYVNNILVREDYSENNFELSTQKHYSILSYLVTGINKLYFEVTNIGAYGRQILPDCYINWKSEI